MVQITGSKVGLVISEHQRESDRSFRKSRPGNEIREQLDHSEVNETWLLQCPSREASSLSVRSMTGTAVVNSAADIGEDFRK